MSSEPAKSESTNKPAFVFYVVEDRGKGKKPFFTKVGAAWPTKKGTGHNVNMAALPVNGRLFMAEAGREPEGLEDASELAA